MYIVRSGFSQMLKSLTTAESESMVLKGPGAVLVAMMLNTMIPFPLLSIWRALSSLLIVCPGMMFR